MLFMIWATPAQTARERGDALGINALTLRNMRIGQVVKMVREWVWERPALAKSDPESAMFLASLIALKTNEANALLAVAPQTAKAPLKSRCDWLRCLW
jgi:hypothetical protein